MHFRLQYITAGFEFGDAEIKASDAAKQIDVLIKRRPALGTNAPVAPDDGLAIVTCQREIPARHHKEAAASGKLSIKKESVKQVTDDMCQLLLHTLRLARWRADRPNSPPNPIRWSVEFSWSLDGVNWKAIADNLSLHIEFGPAISPWTCETAEFVQAAALTEVDEPLAHELLREAFVNHKANPRSSLVLAVAAAEVGFKQFAAKAMPEASWLLELPAPPLLDMLKGFPWAGLKVRLNGKVATIPESIKEELKKAVLMRNKVVHAGTVNLTQETLESVLRSVHDLLYFLDALNGQAWALGHIRSSILEQFA